MKEYLSNEKAKLNEVENNLNTLIKEINTTFSNQIQESAHIYKGLAGLKTAHLNLIDELTEGEEYVFFSVEKSALEQDAVKRMFKSLHQTRDERKVTARGIALPQLRKTF